MADRFPLILNTNANQIQEIASGDSLDLTGTNIANAGIITAGNVVIGAATTDLIVNGDARITGILTIGTSSLKLDGPNNLVNVGTALTLGHTQGLQFHTQNLHSAGFDVNQINASGIITSTGAVVNGNIDANGDLDVDGHTNLDNVNVVGVLTVTGAVNASHSTFGNLTALGLSLTNTNATINFNDTNNNPDYRVKADTGVFDVVQFNNGGSDINVVKVNTDGHIDIATNVDFAAGIDVTGNATVSGNLSVGGVLTYEDVTNVDSVGIVTARNGLKVTGGTSNFSGASHFVGIARFNETIVGTARTAIKLTCTDESTDTTTYPLFVAATTGDQFPKTGTNLSFNSASGALSATSFVGGGSGLTSLSGSVVASALNGQDISGLGNIGINATLTARNGVFNDNGGSSPTVSISTDDQSPWALQIKNDTYWNNASNGLKIYQSNAGDVYTTVQGNGAFVNHYIQTINGGTTNNAIHIDTNRAVNLKYQNAQRLATTNSGIDVTGNIIQTGNLNVNDSQYLYIGNGGDLRMHHDQANTINYINSENGNLRVQQGGTTLIQMTGSQVKLYHSGNERLNTSANTVNIVNGGLSVSRSNAAHAGTIYFSGTDTNHMLWQDHWDHPQGTRQNSGTFDGIKWNCYDGLMLFRGNEASNIASFLGGNNGCELYHNNTKRFETTAEGFKMSQSNNYLDFPGGMYLRGTGSGWNTRVTTTYTSGTSIFAVQDHAGENVFNVYQDDYVAINNPYNFYIGGSWDSNYTTSDGVRFMRFGGNNARWMTNTFNQSSGNNTPGPYLYNRNSSHNGVRFYVKVNGGVINHSGNNSNLCDERMKTNITDAPSYWNSIKNIGFKKFNYKSEPAGTPLKVGVIAQQVETIESDLVDEDFAIDGNPNEEGTTYMKSVHEEQLFMMGLKALQEAQARIETLEAEVAALKSS